MGRVHMDPHHNCYGISDGTVAARSEPFRSHESDAQIDEQQKSDYGGGVNHRSFSSDACAGFGERKAECDADESESKKCGEPNDEIHDLTLSARDDPAVRRISI